MKKFLSLSMVALVAIALCAPVLAGDDAKGKETKLTGYITDEWCGAKNANADGADCARSCAKKGSDLAIYSGGQLYKLSNKDLAMQHIGHEVVVTGVVDEKGMLQVSSIEKSKKDA